MASRPTPNVDYRANVERQSREQKSVGSLLAYLVYGLLGLFLIGAVLSGYGAYTITKQLNQQSSTIGEVDARYAAANKDLLTKLASTQETLALAQAQITREQELIRQQQDDIGNLRNAANDNASALKAEKQVRTQETAALRGRLRDLEKATPASPKY